MGPSPDLALFKSRPLLLTKHTSLSQICLKHLFFSIQSQNLRAMATNWKLDDHPKLPKGKTVAMIVLDGWGESAPDEYNCIHTAPTPTMDSLKNVCTL